MVNPGGTGRPRLAISARFAPLPPRRSRMPALPSALPSPKPKTHFWRDAFAATGLRGAAAAGLRLVVGVAARVGALRLAAGFFAGFFLRTGFRVRAAALAM